MLTVAQLAPLKDRDPYLYETLTRIVTALNATSQRAGVDPATPPPAPAAIASINVQASNGWFDIAIADPSDARPGLFYFAESDTTPAFHSPRVYFLGASRNLYVQLGPDPLLARLQPIHRLASLRAGELRHPAHRSSRRRRHRPSSATVHRQWRPDQRPHPRRQRLRHQPRRPRTQVHDPVAAAFRPRGLGSVRPSTPLRASSVSTIRKCKFANTTRAIWPRYTPSTSPKASTTRFPT